MEQGRWASTQFPGPLQFQGQDKSAADTLLVLCTDPMLDQTLLGEFRSVPLLLWRSPGPTIPPSGSGDDAVEAVFQEALGHWDVQEIIVCGHLPSRLLRDPEEAPLPEVVAVAIQSLCRLVKQKHGQLSPEQFHQAVVEENVLLQMTNLGTYPCILSAVTEQRVRLYGWIYDCREEVLYVRGPGESSLLRRTRKFVPPAPGPRPYHNPCDFYLA